MTLVTLGCDLRHIPIALPTETLRQLIFLAATVIKRWFLSVKECEMRKVTQASRANLPNHIAQLVNGGESAEN